MADTQIRWGDFILDGLVHTAPCNESGAMLQGHEQSMNCWCAPSLEAVCPTCRSKRGQCWKCGGTGTIEGSIQDPKRVFRTIHRNFTNDDDA